MHLDALAAAEQMAQAAERRYQLEQLKTACAAKLAALKKARMVKNGGSGGRPNKAQQKEKDDLEAEMARLEAGLLPGEAPPEPAPP